ncbi:MAG: PKD domain-containing protein [Candidatus Scalindua rubra]|nr:PKD domain-containing protein [Candidatus Scalindua rubra]
MRLSQTRIEQRQSPETKAKSSCLKAVLHALLYSITVISLLSIGTDSALSAPKGKKGKPAFPVVSLPANAQGERAIEALADKLPEVAAWYGSTTEQFSTMLREDHTARIDKGGHLFFVEDAPDQAGETETPSVSAATFPYDQTFKLHSLPSSKKVLYIDFDGHSTTGTAWNSSYGDPINSPAYDLDGNPSSFSNAELDRIQGIWELVAEDYAPFDVDVTTEDPGQDAIDRSSSSDDRYGTRVVITVDDFASCGCGGFAYVRVFDYVGSFYKPAFVFNKSLIGAAEAISHEAGHNFGLSHDGVTGGAAYYQGQGGGATGWAPIMGVGYYKQLVQWSKGEYADASNTQDDIQIIQNNGALLLADDHGNDQVSATALGSTTDGNTLTLRGNGLIGTRTDVDFFRFMSGVGDISINISPTQLSPNLDILAKLYNASGTLIASSNPVDSLPASINETALPAGEYFVMIDGVGKGDPQVTGYSDYASLGKYTISGSAPDAGGMQFPVAVANASIDPPLTAPLTANFIGSGSFDPDGSIAEYNWVFGDGSASSSISDPLHTYYAPGNYTSTLTVTDNDGLTNSTTVVITVENKAPIAVASSDQTSGAAPLTINFNSTGSYDPDEPYGTITAYSWDFGDGSSSTDENPSHSYSTGGTFNATVTVTDDLGDTGRSDTVTITVSSPPVVAQYVSSENYVAGTVTGSYTDTFADDGTVELIKERESGGKSRNRYSYLEHIWIIPVQSGNSVTLSINAWQSSSTDGDNFIFAYSTDGGTTYHDVLTIGNTTDNGVVTVVLPPETQGNVLIRVKDTNRSKGNRAMDTLFMDKLYITTESQTGSPPAAPTLLSADNVTSGQIGLSWMDNASDEYGFHIERSTNNGVLWDWIATVGKDIKTYSDTNVSPDSTFWYRISAYNGSGQSGYNGPINVTTPQSAIGLSANGYKQKRKKMVDLSWNGATSNNVDIYRNGTLIQTTSNLGIYTDNTGNGGGSYTYQVCESDASNCSNTVTVNF